MNKVVLSITCVWLFFALLFSATGQTSANKPVGTYEGMSPENIQFFSRELVVELEHYIPLNIEEIEPVIEEQLRVFFSSYNYYKELAGFFRDNINVKNWQISGAVPGQMVYTNEILLETAFSGLQNLDRNKKAFFNSLKIVPGHAYTFGNDRFRSFVTISLVSDSDDKQQELLLFLLATGLTLKNREKTQDAVYNNLLQIRGLYLNWLFVNQEYVFTGGPGGLPVPDSLSCCDINWLKEDKKNITPATRQLQEQVNDPGIYPVDVYILDTIPGKIQMQNARTVYYPVNQLIRDLFDSLGKKFQIVHFDTGSSTFYSLQNEKYGNLDMSDHGVYIAGIIHCLSPYANLHLVEVLNSLGSGSLDSLLWGFHLIWENQQKTQTPFIINASLTTKIVPVVSTAERYEIINAFYEKDSVLPLFYAIDKEEPFFSALTWVINLFQSTNCLLAAAAGNDSSPSPGYPANLGGNPAFSQVLAVGACDRAGNKSSFSNFPGVNGLLAFGGEVDAGGFTRDAVSSSYFSSVYQGIGVPNTTGKALWAGTSFSTGIVSGVMAALLSNGIYTAPGARNVLISSCYKNAANILFLPVY